MRRITLFLFAALAMPTLLEATTIVDFDNGTHVSGSLYTQNGYRVMAVDSGVGLNHFDLGDTQSYLPPGPGVDNEIYLHGGNPEPPPPGYSLSRGGNAEEIVIDRFGQPFDLVSLDVDRLAMDPMIGPCWEVVSSSNITHLLTTVGSVTFEGPGWSNLSFLTIRSQELPHLNGDPLFGVGIDNITLRGVPEPAALLLALLGLALLPRRRRRWVSRPVFLSAALR